MTEQLATSTLTLQHRIPDDWEAGPWAEVRPLVDGVDVLKEVHPDGVALSCRSWTGPAESWPLAVTEEPRRIMITEPVCTAGCSSPEGVDVEFHQIRGPGEPTDPYVYELFVLRDQSVEEQVRRLAGLILADDPRKTADRER